MVLPDRLRRLAILTDGCRLGATRLTPWGTQSARPTPGRKPHRPAPPGNPLRPPRPVGTAGLSATSRSYGAHGLRSHIFRGGCHVQKGNPFIAMVRN
jgi:hypothetical protein